MEHPPTLLCVHPHPDDESISCGGLLAATAAAGRRTVVVTCTGGEEGENLAGIDLGDEDLPTHRRRELAAALTALSVTTHHNLGYRDSGMAGSPANDHPDCFHQADLDEAAGRLAALIRAERPLVVVSDDEAGTYGHPDHVKAHLVTVRAVALAADPAAAVDGEPWQVPKRYVHTIGRKRLVEIHQALTAAGRPSPFGDDLPDEPAAMIFGTEDGEITAEVDVQPFLDVKREALQAHRSQIGEESFFLGTPPELLAEVFGTEQYVLEEHHLDEVDLPAAGTKETDLFAGVVSDDGPASRHDRAQSGVDPAGTVAS